MRTISLDLPKEGEIVRNSSALFFRCFPQKITKITLAFGVIINKNLSKPFQSPNKVKEKGPPPKRGAKPPSLGCLVNS